MSEQYRKYLVTTENEKIKWYGNTSHKTNTSCFFLDQPHEPDTQYGQEQRDAFEAVVNRLADLTETKDGNGSIIAEFVALRRAPHVWVVAYRFTSDWAYHQYRDELTKIGSSLGRGTFEPFSADRLDFERFVK